MTNPEQCPDCGRPLLRSELPDGADHYEFCLRVFGPESSCNPYTKRLRQRVAELESERLKLADTWSRYHRHDLSQEEFEGFVLEMADRATEEWAKSLAGDLVAAGESEYGAKPEPCSQCGGSGKVSTPGGRDDRYAGWKYCPHCRGTGAEPTGETK